MGRVKEEAGEDMPATGTGIETTVFEKLAEPFPAKVVEWRAQTVSSDGKRALALCYVDARSIMARLDEALGPQNWQDSYRHEGGRIICRLELRLPGVVAGTFEWIAKEDGSGDSNFESEKGGISGALKRAAVKWGIGRYLYDVDAIWADCKSYMPRGDDRGGGKKKPVFDSWTDAGKRALDEALRAAPGPRSTGRPFAVDKMLELIRDAGQLSDLRRIWEAHWATIPLDYRREVLLAKDAKRKELEGAAGSQEERRDDRQERS